MFSKIAVISGALLLSFAAFAQNETSFVTVVASRTLDLPIEQVAYSVQVASPVDATLSQVVQALQGLGIGAKDLTAVYSTSTFQANGTPGPPQLTWYFSLTTPFSQFQQTLARLLAAAAPTAANKDLAVSFSISSASAAQATIDQAANSAIPDLIADARIRAKRLADAAGLTVGVILDLNDGQSGSGGAVYAVFNGGLGGFSSPKLTVSATVRFALLRYSSN
jgi:uncharacterized protein YggE